MMDSSASSVLFNFLSTTTTLLVMMISSTGSSRFTAEAARAFFVFGDSLVDSGNNNYLVTTARADSPPYGIDYPTHRPTGRFSNGLNLPDLISKCPTLEQLHKHCKLVVRRTDTLHLHATSDLSTQGTRFMRYLETSFSSF